MKISQVYEIIRKALLLINVIFAGQCFAENVTVELRESRFKGSLSSAFLAELKTIFNSHHFIETGTFGGVTTMRAAQIFSQAHTVELSDIFYQRNSSILAPYKNIHAYLGESPIILDRILPGIKKDDCLFFLDAHYTPGCARSHENTPLISEIQSIGRHTTSSVILIDDLRCCQTQGKIAEQLRLNPHEACLEGYPSLSQIKEEALKINKSYEFAVYGDLALIYPKDKYPHVVLSPVVRAMTISRLFEELECPSRDDVEEVIKAEQEIMRAQGEEKIAIQQLLMKLEGRELPPLFTTHYKLWNALIYMNEGDYQRALDLLKEAYSFGLFHERMQQYLSLAQDKLSKA